MFSILKADFYRITFITQYFMLHLAVVNKMGKNIFN